MATLLTNTGTQVYPTVEKAYLVDVLNKKKVPIQFNPTSLVYTVESLSDQKARDPKRRQYVKKHNAKLTMDLQFDTTDTGVDVRTFTNPIGAFMESSAGANKKGGGTSSTNPPAPAVLSFEWGAYQFQGFMESFKETIDFFSASGIPLRALVSIGLAAQEEVFSDPTRSASTAANLAPPDPSSVVPTADDDDVTSAATQGGDPSAGRALASANGIENPRFTGGADLEVGAGIQLNAAVAFVASASVGAGIGVSGGLGLGISAGAGIGVSAGAGIGISAGASAGVGIGIGGGASAGFGIGGGASAGFGIGGGAAAGFGIGGSVGASAGAGFGIGASAGAGIGISGGAAAGFGIGASAGAGFSVGGAAIASAGITASSGAGSQVTLAAGGGALFGSRASAGVPATLGAFAGLEVGRATISTTAQLDPLRMLPATVGTDVAVGANASFGLGGMALSPPGFSTNVGASFSYEDSLTFDSD